MSKYVFDIETDGLLDSVTRIHSLVLYDIGMDTPTSCSDNAEYFSIEAGLDLLDKADLLIGHNILKFDLQVIDKLYPNLQLYKRKNALDTLLISRLLYPDIIENDTASYYRSKLGNRMPRSLMGKHSLEAWGHRLKEHKGDYKGDWETWSKEMQLYCEQDVKTTFSLYKYLMDKKPSQQSVELEHNFQRVIIQQEKNGFPFNESKALELSTHLKGKRDVLIAHIKSIIPDKVIEKEFIPRSNRPSLGYIKGVPVVQREVIQFNPASRVQIIKHFKDKGWIPSEFTDKKNPKVDEDILSKLPYPEAKPIAELFHVSKVLGYISEGNKAWLSCSNNGRIHGGVITNGAVTGRVTHVNPNLGQIPSAGSEIGKLCRELFYAPEPYVMVGCDLSQIELRLLAHFLHAYDGGKYVKVVEDGDVHTVNQKAAGLEKRDDAKTFIYAFTYGAGDGKLGSILAPNAPIAVQRTIGKKLKTTFLKKIPAIDKLISDAKVTFNSRGNLYGLDGRELRSREDYSALNALIQGAGAVVAKQWNVSFWEDYHEEVYQLVFVHDEIQVMCRPEIADEVGKRLVQKAEEMTAYFDLKCKITAEYKIAKTWAGAH